MAQIEDLTKQLAAIDTKLNTVLRGYQITEELTQQIQAQYRDVLGRDADPAGLANFLGAMRRGDTLDSVRQALIESAEYKAKH